MKIFLDSACLEEIQEAALTGLIDGVTTNPSLIAQGKRPFETLIRDICAVIGGPVSAEVIAEEASEMVKEGIALSKISSNVVVKVPLTREGLKACRILRMEEGIEVNVTLCFSSAQALLAAKAGATFVSPFIGRLDDIGSDGLHLLSEIRHIYSTFPDFKTQILAASIRHPQHVVEAAKQGADIATIPYHVFQHLYHHPLTDKGLKDFLKDWSRIPEQFSED